ncbi:hypothetical protein SMRU11_23975 [Sinorhizobium meliloti RU11/001]|nr:terminase small subunit [Sinorhizobium meliloti]ARS70114.1 hypothetical protein SMRU11_23975 [Sinorhizobium meliloti RU11/001]
MTDLTAKQARFVEEYLIDLNATRAAIRAGYSRNGADTTGPRLLEDPRIIAAIDARKIERSERTQIDATWVLKRLADEAEADIADLYDEKTGDLKPIHEWPEIWRQGLVAGVEIDAIYDGHGEDRVQIGHAKKVRFSERIRRLELIGKHVRVNAFQEQVALKGLDGLAERMERAKSRSATACTDPVAERFPAEPEPEPVPVPATVPDLHPLQERMRRAAEREVRQVLKPDWREPVSQPVYSPVLPWPEDNGSTETEYDALSDTLLSAHRDI